MKILCVADHVDPLVYSPAAKERFHDVDLVLGAGDLPMEYLGYISSILNKPILFVFGNHNLEKISRFNRRMAMYSESATVNPFFEHNYGATWTGGRVTRSNGLLVAGLGGSKRYNDGLNQYTDLQMYLAVIRLLPGLVWNLLRCGRWLDILLTHSPPRGIHDQEDPCHLKPKSEIYRGMQTVPVNKIVGSEGRYRDFNKRYLPRYEYLRRRWTSIDMAHLQDVVLPPIKLYEIGGLYFVRDGNHRVSVARMQGVLDIDAEVVSLGTEIRLDPNGTMDTLREDVIRWEEKRFFESTGLSREIPAKDLLFSATGRYDEILQHILVHKYYINQNRRREISLAEAALSWYRKVYLPIITIIRGNRILRRFPGRTAGDLYVWISRHWDALKQKYGADYSMDDAARDFSLRYGRGLRAQTLDLAYRIYSLLAGKKEI